MRIIYQFYCFEVLKNQYFFFHFINSSLFFLKFILSYFPNSISRILHVFSLYNSKIMSACGVIKLKRNLLFVCWLWNIILVKRQRDSGREREVSKELIILFLPQDIAMSACVDEKHDFNLAARRAVSHKGNSRQKIKDTLVSSDISHCFFQTSSFERPRGGGKKNVFPDFYTVLSSAFCSCPKRPNSLSISLFIFALLDLTRTERYSGVFCLYYYFPFFKTSFWFI